jgi:hypothetical protein
MSLLRRSAALARAFVGAAALATAAPTAAAAAPATATTTLVRYSGNGCGGAEFDYT